MKATIQFQNARELEAVLNAFAGQFCRPEDSTLPPLYKSGITYQREGVEHFQSPWETFQLGYGDCEDLAVYLVAERRRAGDLAARVVVVRTGQRTLHAIIERGDGRREDPSRALGMVRLGEDYPSFPTAPPSAPGYPSFPTAPPSAPGYPAGADPLDMVAALYPGASVVIALLKNPKARKLLVKLAKKLKKVF